MNSDSENLKPLNSIEPDDIVFYKRKNDWRNDIKHCTLIEMMNSKEDIEFYDFDDYDKVRKIYRSMKESNKTLVKVRFENDGPNTSHYVKWDDFNPAKMTVIEESKEEARTREINLKEMIKSGKAPGFVSKTSRDRGSVMHKGKIDEGAMEDLLDKSLPKAEKRATERQSKTGHAFTKNNTNKTILRRK